MTIQELANLVAIAHLNENPDDADCPPLSHLDYLFFNEVGELTSDKLRLVANSMDELEKHWHDYRDEWWRCEREYRDELQHQKSFRGEI
jgi:hypothetical protein